MRHVLEHTHVDTAMTVDILAERAGPGGQVEEVVLEVEGPTHYMRNVR